MNISLAHVQEVKGIFLVPSAARCGCATGELQIHLNWNKKCSLSIYFFFLSYIFTVQQRKFDLTFGVSEVTSYAGIPKRMIGFSSSSTSVTVASNRWYRRLVSCPDINSRRWTIVSLRVVRTEFRVSLVLMQSRVETRSRSRGIQDRRWCVAAVPVPIAGSS